MPIASRRTRLTAFARFAGRRLGRRLDDFSEIHRLSVGDAPAFWDAFWDFAGVQGERGSRIAVDLDRMPGARFFPDARLNFAENVLRRRDDAPAIIAITEDGDERTISFRQLHDDVMRAALALRAEGVEPGDRVCGLVANVPEAIVAALGAAAIGGVWSSCSPDFGVQGVLDRFGQIEPTVLVAVDGYQYGGKTHDCLVEGRGDCRRAPERSPRRDRAVAGRPGSQRDPRRGSLGGLARRATTPATRRVRAAAVRPSALHPLFVRHDGRAEVHRARRRRHAASST